MTVNGLGIASIGVFYLCILAIGLFAAWKKKKRVRGYENQSERAMVGERDIGLFVLSFTMTGDSDFCLSLLSLFLFDLFSAAYGYKKTRTTVVPISKHRRSGMEGHNGICLSYF